VIESAENRRGFMCGRYTGLLRWFGQCGGKQLRVATQIGTFSRQRRRVGIFYGFEVHKKKGPARQQKPFKSPSSRVEIAVSTLDSTAFAARLKIGPAARRGVRSGCGEAGFRGGGLWPLKDQSDWRRKFSEIFGRFGICLGTDAATVQWAASSAMRQTRNSPKALAPNLTTGQAPVWTAKRKAW
jgi:hypothetical protein